MRIGVVGVGRIGAFHASTLKGLAAIDQVAVADVDPDRAAVVAKDLDVEHVADIDALLASGLDGLVITAATSAHAGLLGRAVTAGVTTFCEKPVAHDLATTLDVVKNVEASDVKVQIGFQRRFDAGYRRAAEAVRAGELGWLHSIRANTNDAYPPPAEYLPTSGGFFRDCTVHDFDIIRFVTGREVTSVYAVGTDRGEPMFVAAGDIGRGRRAAHAGGRHLRQRQRHPLQRGRARRADGAARAVAAHSRSGWTSTPRCGPPSRAWRSRPGRRTRPSWTASTRRTSPS